MKTTIDIADPLLEALRTKGAREGRTLKDLVEDALRRFLGSGSPQPPRFKLRRRAFKGRGIRPGLTEGRWDQLRDLIYPM